jgi:hypothetical protein
MASEPSISLGVKNKDMDSYMGCAPCSPCDSSDDPAKKKEWENEMNYPCFTVCGQHAELMGADDLEVNDVVEVTLKLIVKGKRDDSRRADNKVKRDISIDFEICETSNMKDLGKDENYDGEPDTGAESDTKDEPVMAILSDGNSEASGEY